MARPLKQGLDYFPVDTDMDQDDKVIIIVAKYGMEGFGILVKLFMEIYKNGYFYQWSEKEQIIFSSRVNVDINLVKELVSDCVKWGLFHEDLFNAKEILTSKGIQERYALATSRRVNVAIKEELRLVSVDINSNSSEKQVAESTQKKGKETKQNKTIKRASSKYDELLESEFDKFWNIYPKKADKKKAFEKFKTASKNHDFGVIVDGAKKYAKECEVKGTEKQFIKHATTFLNAESFLNEFEVNVKTHKKDNGIRYPDLII
jgi:hypothetical protein